MFKMCETSSGPMNCSSSAYCKRTYSIPVFRCSVWKFISCFLLVLASCSSVKCGKILPCKIKNGFYTITVHDGDINGNEENESSTRSVSITDVASVDAAGFISITSDDEKTTYKLMKTSSEQDALQFSLACCPRESGNQSNLSNNLWSGIKIKLSNRIASLNQSQKIHLSVRHAASTRLDVYNEVGTHILPVNVNTDDVGTSFMNQNKSVIDQSLSNKNGDNYYTLRDGRIVVNLQLSSEVHIRPVPIVLAILRVKMSSSSDGLIQQSVVSSLTDKLSNDVNPSNLMVIRSCYEMCEQSYSAFHIVVSIGDKNIDQYITNGNENSYVLSPSKLSFISENIVNLVQSTELESSTNLVISQVSVPMTWFHLKNSNMSLCLRSKMQPEMSDFDVKYETPRAMRICKALSNGYKSVPLLVKPQVLFLNSKGDRVRNIGSLQNSSWTVVVSLIRPQQSSAVLVGQTSVSVIKGLAKFSNLAITSVGKGFRLKFEVFASQGGSNAKKLNISTTSNIFNIDMRPLKLKISNVPYKAKEGELFSPSPKVQIIDSFSGKPPPLTFLQKYEWKVRIYILDEEYYNGSQLMGTTTKTLAKDSNFTHFTDLYLTQFGYQYKLGVQLISAPQYYKIDDILGPFDVERDVDTPREIEESWVVQVTFDGQYDLILPKKEAFFVYFLNNFGFRYDEVLWGNVSISPGSVIANATISGTVSELESTTEGLRAEMMEGESATFNGTTMAIAGVATTRPPVSAANSENDAGSDVGVSGTAANSNTIPNAWIVAIVLNVILGIIFIIAIIYWYKKHKNSSRQVYSEDAKVFEKTIATDGSLENKAAASNKQRDIYTINVDDVIDGRESKRSTYSARSDERRLSTKEEDRLSYLGRKDSSYDDRSTSRNESRFSRPNSNRSRRSSVKSHLSKSRSDPDLRSSSTQRSYYEDRPHSSDDRRGSLGNNSRRSASPGPYAYDEREEDEHNREKYLVYEITGDNYRSRDYIAYIMLPEESPPTLTKTREYFSFGNTAPALQEISHLDFVFLRETGKYVSKALENSALVSDIFPNREILVQLQNTKGTQKQKTKEQPRGIAGYLKNAFVSDKVRDIHKNAIGVQCQRQDCGKEAIMKCTFCGKAPYCSKKCMIQDSRFHAAVCYKPPWKT